MKKLFPINPLTIFLAAVWLSATWLPAAPVYETELEFVTTGDFNGDGRDDIVIVDKYTGRLRVGYRLSPEFFDWVNWRAGGMKSVTGVAVGRLTDAKHDTLALSSADANLVTIVDSADPKVPSDSVKIPSAVFGPKSVAMVDIGGAGNTPLPDLYLASIYNSEPTPNRVTLFRNDGKKFAQISELPVAGEVAHANRLSLRVGGPELLATISSGKGNELRIEKFDAGKPEEVLTIADLPAGADYVAGNFTGTALKDFVFYTAGEAGLRVTKLEETGGKFKASALKTVALKRPVRQLVLMEGEKKSRLLAIFGDQEPAEVLDFDGQNAPVTVQQLAGATNKFLSVGVALPDAVVLFSTLTNDRPRSASHYQVHLLKDGKFVPGPYGSLASLTDRDDSTVPEIQKRIVEVTTEKSAPDMKPYTNNLPGSDVTYEMVPIPGGEFLMGSPDIEKDRKPDEGPQHRVKISPFWMGKYEVTWDQYLLFMYPDDEKKLRENHPVEAGVSEVSDAVTRPSKPYVDMSFGMGKSASGKKGFPAIAMTQHAANKFCHWLSAKTGHFYRLPTEAEWEYACRAGTTTAYFFGDDPKQLADYGWFFDNSDSKYQEIGKKKPNPWGLYDMYGNVTEWVLDQYDADFYKTQAAAGTVTDPWNRATQPYPHSARGGSWDDDPPMLRSAARRGSDRSWKMTDPQLPKGMWYLTDAKFIGFRIVRPLAVPSAEELTKYWISGVEKD